MSRAYSEVAADLVKPLDESRVKHRDVGRGRQAPYLEGFDLIARANDIFGFDGWSYRVDDVHASTTTVGRIFYRAVVTVEALGVRRTDIGVSVVEVRRDNAEDAPDAHDMAIKGATTDGLKRALRSFGAQFGNELYDKGTDHAPRTSERNRAPAPEGPKGAKSNGAKPTGGVGDFLAWAWKEHHVNKTAVLALLRVENLDGVDLEVARAAVIASKSEPVSAE